MLAILGSIAAFLAPLGVTLFENLVSGLISTNKDKKAAQEEAKKLLFNVYLEVNNNLASFRNFNAAAAGKWKINSIDCKTFIAQFETKAINKLLTHITDIKKISETEAYNAMLRFLFAEKELRRLSKLTDTLLENQPNYNVKQRLENIKKQNLTIYRQLFKKEPKSGQTRTKKK